MKRVILILPVLALAACGTTPAERETPINWGKPDPALGAVLAAPRCGAWCIWPLR